MRDAVQRAVAARFGWMKPAQLYILAVVTIVKAGCSAMTIPCPTHDNAELVGTWRYVGRLPGAPAKFADEIVPPPQQMKLYADGRYELIFGNESLQRLRSQSEHDPADGRYTGTWQIDWFCPGDLFLPRQWLRMSLRPPPRLFDRDGERLTLFFPGGSGCCDEVYELADPVPPNKRVTTDRIAPGRVRE